MRKSVLLGAASLLLLTTAAQAQVAAPAANDPAQDGPVGEIGLPDIVVTASKVETTLQRTPTAVTSATGEELFNAGVARAQDLVKLVPGLQVEQNGGGASSIFIRGVGSRVLTPVADPAVAFSVDGVYYSRAAGPSQTLFDLERVEVVKGPQGTLYGRNATGGAVNVVTNRPVIGETGGRAALEIGNYDAVTATGAINLPVNDRLAFRLAGQYVYHEGYLSDGYNDEDSKSLRASMLFTPDAQTEIYVSADWANQGGQGGNPVPVGPRAAGVLTSRFVVPGNPWTGPSDPRLVAFLNTVSPRSTLTGPGAGPYCPAAPFGGAAPTPGASAILLCSNPLGLQAQTNQGFNDNDFFGLNVTVERDLGFATLTGIAAYRGTRVDSAFYPDKSITFFTADVDQYTAELRLASNPDESRLKWLVGAFYLDEQSASRTQVTSNNMALPNPSPAPGSPLPRTTCAYPLGTTGLCAAEAVILQNNLVINDPDLENETYAAFGQATFALSDRFRLTGGLRYTHETKVRRDGTVVTNYTRPANLSISYPAVGEIEDDDTSYRVGVEFDLAERSMAYASYSTAFHAGGINFGVAQGPNRFVYDPETVKASVIGIKNRFFDNRLQFNVEGFYLDYDNYQTQRLGRINDGSAACSTLGIVAACPLTVRTENAAVVEVKGVETDLVLAVGDHGRFDLNALYSNAEFVTFLQPNAFTGAVVDYSGRRLPGNADWVISAGYEQRFPLSGGAEIVASVRSQYRSDADMWFTQEPGNFQPAFTRTDLNLAFEAPSGAWTAAVFVRNVEDEATILQGSPADANAGVPYVILNPPRTYGFNLSLEF